MNHTTPGPLNDVFRTHGIEEVKKIWKKWYRADPVHAVKQLNEPDLVFPVLYSLKSDLHKDDQQLSLKNRLALYHIESIINGEPFHFPMNADFFEQHHHGIHCLRWIVSTGATEKVDEHYTAVVDGACLHLLHHFNEDCLGEIVDIIFHRHRAGEERHYLLSAFYDANEPQSLLYVARYLYSNAPEDVVLAKKILGFIPGVKEARDGRESAETVAHWLESNLPYLIHTGENNDSFPHPIPYAVHTPAKYLGVPIDRRTGTPYRGMTSVERERWEQFIRLPHALQVRLAAHSERLRRWQRQKWREWMRQPLQEQIRLSLPGEGRP